MTRSKKQKCNSRAWTIIAIASILLILFLTIFCRNKSLDNPYNISKYISLYKPIQYPKKQNRLNTNINTHTDISPKTPGYISKSEGQCKIILERLFGREFNKTRPDFLKNDVTGRNLELDLYNPELKLCVEVNGKQHYQYIPYFHTSKDAFYNQRYRDEMKKTKCRENGINYLEIPYNVKLDDLEDYIISKCRDFGYNI